MIIINIINCLYFKYKLRKILGKTSKLHSNEFFRFFTLMALFIYIVKMYRNLNENDTNSQNHMLSIISM